MNLSDRYIIEISRDKEKISEHMHKMKLNNDLECSDEEMTELVIISGYYELILNKLKMNKKLTVSENKKIENMHLRIIKLIN